MKLITRWRLILGVGLLVSTALREVAWAEPRAKVVLVTASQESTTARRLEAELRNLDIEVVRVTAAAESLSIRKELQRIAQEQGAFAAVRIVPSDNEAEVWVADRVTGKTLVREVLSGKRGVDLDDAISLGAVELLRASLLEVAHSTDLKGDVAAPAVVQRLLPPPPEGVLSPKKAEAVAPEAAASSRRAELWLTLAPSADMGIGRLATGSSVEASLKLVGARGFGAELLGRAPFYGQEVRERSATAVITSKQVAILGVYAPHMKGLSPSLAVGWVALSVTSHGKAAPPLVTQEEQRLRYAPMLRAGLGYRLLPYLGLRVDGNLAYATAPLEIRIAGKKAADYGRPSLSLAAGVELRLPLQLGE